MLTSSLLLLDRHSGISIPSASNTHGERNTIWRVQYSCSLPCPRLLQQDCVRLRQRILGGRTSREKEKEKEKKTSWRLSGDEEVEIVEEEIGQQYLDDESAAIENTGDEAVA
jgi:hypothetical protein